MNIKAGNIWMENGSIEDAIFQWEVGKTVDIVTNDDLLILRIDPNDFIAISDAIVAAIKREAEQRAKKLMKLP